MSLYRIRRIKDAANDTPIYLEDIGKETSDEEKAKVFSADDVVKFIVINSLVLMFFAEEVSDGKA